MQWVRVEEMNRSPLIETTRVTLAAQPGFYALVPVELPNGQFLARKTPVIAWAIETSWYEGDDPLSIVTAVAVEGLPPGYALRDPGGRIFIQGREEFSDIPALARHWQHLREAKKNNP